MTWRSKRASFRGLAALVGASLFAVNCGSSNTSTQAPDSAIMQLSNPSSLSISGTGAAQMGATSYVFADAAGAISASNNQVTAAISDPNLPLDLGSTSAYSDAVSSGSCGLLGALYAMIGGAQSNQAITNLSATGCTDRSVLSVSLDTTQLFDTYGFEGTDTVSLPVTVDTAPEVSAVASGNTAANGSGTTEGTAGAFSLAHDLSVVVTFTKSVQGGTLNASLYGCSANLGMPAMVANGDGTTVAWPLTQLSGEAAGDTCTFDVGGVTDEVGNPDDPSDPHQGMTIRFE